MIRYSRKPALLIVLLAAAGVWWLQGFGADAANINDAPALADLQVLIAQPDAGRDLWLQYAQRLQQDGQLLHAAKAYQRVLQFDPYDRPVSVQCASVLAQAGDADELARFMKQLNGLAPKLAMDIFTRPEMQRYLTQPTFIALSEQARVQSMD